MPAKPFTLVTLTRIAAKDAQARHL